MKAEAEGGDALWVVGDRIRFLGGLPGTGAELVEVEVPAGSGTPPHRHASAELFHVVSGTLTVRLFPEGAPPAAVTAGPGGTVTVPSGVAHQYANESGGPVRMVVLLEPSMIAFFRDAGTGERQEPPDFARLGAAMERHGVTLMATAA